MKLFKLSLLSETMFGVALDFLNQAFQNFLNVALLYLLHNGSNFKKPDSKSRVRLQT
jgi:hypothetical protein